jgi:hypothetical protein
MFRFTIRDWIWLTVVIAVWFGWWEYHESQIQENNEVHWQVLSEKQQQLADAPNRIASFYAEKNRKDTDYLKRRIAELERELSP